jgi:hypothetical protein
LAAQRASGLEVEDNQVELKIVKRLAFGYATVVEFSEAIDNHTSGACAPSE